MQNQRAIQIHKGNVKRNLKSPTQGSKEVLHRLAGEVLV